MNDLFRFGLDPETKRIVGVSHADRRGKHLLVNGKTGSGKTTFLISDALQIIAPHNGTFENVVIISPGDNAFYHRVEAACTQWGRGMQIFNADRGGYKTLRFDPFSLTGHLDALKRAGLLLEGVATPRSREYGPSFFFFCDLVEALLVLEEMNQRGLPLTLSAIEDYLRRRKKNNRDAQHVRNCVAALVRYPQLVVPNPRPPEKEFLSWERMERDNSVVFACVPPLNEPSAPYISSLILHSLVADRMARLHAGEPMKFTTVIWDEWHVAASETMAELMVAVRKVMSLHLANHNLIQLRNFGLKEIATSNCDYQLYFSAGPEEEEHLQWQSLLVPVSYPGSSVADFGLKVTRYERVVMEPKLTHNTVVRASQLRGCALFLDQSKKDEFTDVRTLFCEPDIPFDHFQELASRPLPRDPTPPPADPPRRGVGWRYAPRDDAFLRRERAIKRLVRELEREEVS